MERVEEKGGGDSKGDWSGGENKGDEENWEMKREG